MRTSAPHSLRHVEALCDELVQQTQQADGSPGTGDLFPLQYGGCTLWAQEEALSGFYFGTCRCLLLRLLEPVEPVEPV